jgi:hypothetical protein
MYFETHKFIDSIPENARVAPRYGVLHPSDCTDGGGCGLVAAVVIIPTWRMRRALRERTSTPDLLVGLMKDPEQLDSTTRTDSNGDTRT